MSLGDSEVESSSDSNNVLLEEQGVDLIRTLSEQDPNIAISRIENLAKKLSSSSSKNGNINLDPEDFDLQETLSAIIYQSSKQGIKLRESGIVIKNLSVFGVDESFSFYPTVSSILRGPLTLVKAIVSRKKVPEKVILNKVNGLAKPGEMILVLGRPGAGCTSLLKTLSGTDLDLFTEISGESIYDGINREEMVKNFKNDLIYNPELDIHFPHLTVSQTLDFAIGCKTPQLRVNGVTREQYKYALKEILGTVFGLKHAFHTKVGNEFVKGISGGERKRVSITEALTCRGSLYFWDNSTRGLDSSTALEFARAIRTATNLLKSTVFVTLYQAGESIYNTFDKVTILYKGKQIYFGPISDAKAYFERMGFRCPPRQSTAEFLTAITDPIGRFPKEGYERRVPRSAGEFEEYWLQSPEYKNLILDIGVYEKNIDHDETHKKYHDSIKQEKMKYQRVKSKYTVNYFEQLRLCSIRGFQILWGDKAYVLIQLMAAILQGLIAGSLYYNLTSTVEGAFSRGGIIFFSTLYVSLMGLAEVTASFNNRPILMKQKNYAMYHPSTEALANTVTTAPVSLLTTIAFMLLIYFLSNLAREAGKFFISVLFIFLLALTMAAMFKAIASLNKSIAGANAVSGVFILATLMYSGYMIQREAMHPWFKWISYINPIFYGFEAIISSEFHGRKMECAGKYWTPSGKDYQNISAANKVCAFKGSITGQTWVSGDEYLKVAFSYSFSHVWRNFGILVGFFLFFVGMTALGIEFVRPIAGGGDRLLFLRGKVPDTVIMPDDTSTRDIESSSEDTELSNISKNFVFEDLKSKDIFAWKEVNYRIRYEGSERLLLEQVSGYCIPGTLTALMGESGAGKTTLLNTLAQRIDTGIVTGNMLVNGKPLDLSFRRRTGYVQQQDIHVSELTVKESLIFSARLRRSNKICDQEKLNYVEKIIKVLNMEEYADAIVGVSGYGLNVEQRKKLSIGVELVAKPSLLLFLDEPTSGLDSQSAWAIVKLLRDLSSAGQSILCTIHQPSSALFEEFDRVLLLRKGGQTVYFGDIGKHSVSIIDYFERYGGRKCLDDENPAEYILEVIGAGATAVTDYDWFEIWNNSIEKEASDLKLQELINKIKEKPERESYSESEFNDLQKTYGTPYWYQFVRVLQRNSYTFYRSPEYVASKIFLMTFCGLFIGFSFWSLKRGDGTLSILNSQGGMFCAFLSVVVSAPVINQIQAHAIKGRDLYEGREMLSNTYHYTAMIFAQIVNELPYLIIGSTLMFFSLYFPTKANTAASHAGIFYLTQGIFLQGFVATFGLLTLYISPNVESAAIIFSFFYTFIVAFSGVVQPVQLMPGFWTFMNKVSPYTYFIQNLITSFLHGFKIRCAKDEYSYINPPSGETCKQYLANYLNVSGGYIFNPESTSSCGYCTFSNADQYLKNLGASYSYRWRNIGFFCVYIIFNATLSVLLYKVIRLQKFSKPSIPSVLKRNSRSA